MWREKKNRTVGQHVTNTEEKPEGEEYNFRKHVRRKAHT